MIGLPELTINYLFMNTLNTDKYSNIIKYKKFRIRAIERATTHVKYMLSRTNIYDFLLQENRMIYTKEAFLNLNSESDEYKECEKTIDYSKIKIGKYISKYELLDSLKKIKTLNKDLLINIDIMGTLSKLELIEIFEENNFNIFTIHCNYYYREYIFKAFHKHYSRKMLNLTQNNIIELCNIYINSVISKLDNEIERINTMEILQEKLLNIDISTLIYNGQFIIFTEEASIIPFKFVYLFEIEEVRDYLDTITKINKHF